MKVSITGGTGFVGQQLVAHHLARGDDVRVLSRGDGTSFPSLAGVRWFGGDLSDPAVSLAPFMDDVDVLYHCAGEIRRPDMMQAVHVDGTRRLIEAARGRVRRWVQLSSVGAYGKIRSGDVSESQPDAPADHYEVTKSVADQLVMDAAHTGAFAAVVLRPTIIYGPTMRNQSLFQLMTAISRGHFFYIGKTGASASYVHVDNVVRALSLCATHKAAPGHSFIVSGHTTFERVIEILAAELGRKAPGIRFPEALARLIALATGWIPGMPLTLSRVDAMTSRVCYREEKIASLLGYAPVTSLEAGLTQMVEAWRRGAAHKR